MVFVGDPGPLPRWFWLTVVAFVAALIILMALGVGETVLIILFVIGSCAFLLFIAPRILKRAGGPGALGNPPPKDQ
jgi:hypothetical protein